MDAFFDALALHTPASLIEAVALCAILVVGLIAFWRSQGLAVGAVAMGVALGTFIQTGHIAMPAAIALTGVLLWRNGSSREGLRPFVTQLALVVAGFVAYELARFQIIGGESHAAENAGRIVDFERGLGLFFEEDLQSWANGAGWLTDFYNLIYSHTFLAIVAGVIFWLYFTDRGRFGIYRNALGISTALAIPLIAAFPVAPPRLMPGLGIEDTVVVQGADHDFANPFAAIPSLHVGWLSLTGYVLAMPLSGWRKWAVALGPGLGMLFIVIVTGNHYWVDGLVGSVIAVGPAVMFAHPAALGRAADWLGRTARAGASAAHGNSQVRVTILSLGGLAIYLGVAQVVSPGFTDFWAYLFVQVLAIIVLLLAGELVFAREGGLSWMTHAIAIICTYADVFGTDGDLYARIDEYDKLTHFLGTAAVTAAAYDILRALAVRRNSTRPASDRLTLSIAIGIGVGFAWEVYEYLGDVVFQTARTQGRWDTFNDLISDGLGAVALAMLLWYQERHVHLPAEEPVHQRHDV